jgi:hypothetical protein
MMPDFGDLFLAGIRISLLAQTDDLLIFSLSPQGLNQKLATLAESPNGMEGILFLST